jgi:hypothetical protein
MAAVAAGIEIATGERRVGTRRAALLALSLLLVLNVVDVILTSRFLAEGVAEGNPLMAPVVESSALAMGLKVALLGALGWRFLTRKVAIGVLCAAWGVVGIYAAVAYVNLLVLRSVT